MKFGIDPEDIIAALTAAAGGTISKVHNRFRRQMRGLANATAQHARDMADLRLNSTAPQYKDAIKIEQVDDETYRIFIEDDAQHLEEGFPSFDMKPGLLKNAKKRSSKGYRYRAIPMPSPTEAAANQNDPRHLTQRKITTKAENRLPNELPVGQTTEGLRATSLVGMKEALFAKLGKPDRDGDWMRIDADPMNSQSVIATPIGGGGGARKIDIGTKFHEDLHGGILGKTTSKGGKVGYGYKTFRIVSEDPKYAAKWIHPGFAGARIFPDLGSFVDDRLRKIMDKITDGL